MIPSFPQVSNIPERIFANRTYKLDFDNNRITSNTDGLDAMAQAVVKILKTERFENVIYSDLYGTELKRYIGENINNVVASIKSRIEEALTYDNRVVGIDNISYDIIGGNTLQVTFDVITTIGNFASSTEVIL